MRKIKKLTLLFFTTFFISESFSQILREGFDNNLNGWQIENKDKKERASISNGRYNLKVLDKTNWHYFSLPKIEDKKEFLIETLITKMPRDINYQKVNIDQAIDFLRTRNYRNKHMKATYNGLLEFKQIQDKGGRIDFSPKGSYQIHFLSGNYYTENTAHAAGFISDYLSDLTYDDSLYGLLWGGNQNSNLFAFNIIPEFQMFQVISLINGTWTNIIDFTTSYSIKKGNSTNKLSILKGDYNWHFLINDQAVGKVPAQQFFGKELGFFVGPETNISVDYLNFLYKEEDSSPIENKAVNGSTFSSSGSGFLISEKGYFVTNYHVIEDAKEVWIDSKINGVTKSSKAKVVLVDKNNDLAILKIEGLYNLPRPVFGFNQGVIDVGTSVFAMGYPLLGYMGDEVKITDGIISSRTGYQGDVSSYQISAPIQPGNSGEHCLINLGIL
ncbi:peptidase S1 and S6 chymotrypsin/Hap [Nitritalea halalkaliphila LW7]|uniref:Peptidase S1 and S6 chymotrypsin/Hap n=1 Tax=Nitritalea halalkaliphila LW7 TaxID=1189621 RepID=I5BXU9_9BACT|nr:S1C family serine protease [Nitritalea halalkaliphila]EIM74401.1 peptidase S1 and S6 chymotrypsin/Hap [Nitritalea halalkaliphila LW7]